MEKWIVRLEAEERSRLEQLVGKGKAAAFDIDAMTGSMDPEPHSGGLVSDVVSPYTNTDGSKPAISITGSAGRVSLCSPCFEVIPNKPQQGRSVERVSLNLRHEHGFVDGSPS